MKPTHALYFIVAGALLAACDSAGNEVGPDAGDSPDSGGIEACQAEADYGDVTLAEQKARSLAPPSTPDEPQAYEAMGLVNAEGEPEQLVVTLFEGAGPFANDPVSPGTYQIEGPETNYGTCGVCVRLTLNLDANGEPADPNDIYMATGGTVEITSVTPTMSGTVSNLTFQHATINPAAGFASSPHPDGCASALTSASFEAQVEDEVIGQ